MHDVSVIIVSWNTRDLLRNCIQSIYKQTSRYTSEIIVIDNNSPDQSAEMVKQEFPQVQLLANSTNNGFAPANNQGLAIAQGRYLLLLNPDTIILNGAIDKMLDYYELKSQSNKLGIVTCKLLNGDLTLQESVNRFYSFGRSFIENRYITDMLKKINLQHRSENVRSIHQYETEIDWAYGAVMLFSREVFENIGMLDDRFFIYAEEIDYYLRAKKAGYACVFLPDAQIIHLGQSSSRQRRAAMFIQNYKSFYILLKKHYGSFSYLLYRLRAQIYLVFWFLKFSMGKDEESKVQKQVYKQTLKWHFSKEGWNF